MPLEYASEVQQSKLSLLHTRWIRASAENPLVLMIHGRAGTAKVVSAFTHCFPDNCNLLAPQGDLPDLNGFSWWPVGENKNIITVSQAATKVLNFLSAALKVYKLQPKKIFVLGFSQGAALSSILMQTKPELFDGLILLAGLTIELPTSANLNFLGKKIFIAHGSEDKIIPLSAALKSRTFFEKQAAAVFFHQDPVEHKIGAAGMRQLKNWAHKEIS